MTYQEALDKALTVKWKLGTCSEGEQCWCRTIIPVEDIEWKEKIELQDRFLTHSLYIVSTGEMHKQVAERIVEDHNVIVALSEAMEVEVARLKAKLEDVEINLSQAEIRRQEMLRDLMFKNI